MRRCEHTLYPCDCLFVTVSLHLSLYACAHGHDADVSPWVRQVIRVDSAKRTFNDKKDWIVALTNFHKLKKLSYNPQDDKVRPYT